MKPRAIADPTQKLSPLSNAPLEGAVVATTGVPSVGDVVTKGADCAGAEVDDIESEGGCTGPGVGVELVGSGSSPARRQSRRQWG